MLKDKVRVYILARELDMESKDLLDLCRNAGLDVKNQLSSLDPDQRDMIESLVRKGGASALGGSGASAGGVLSQGAGTATLTAPPLPKRPPVLTGAKGMPILTKRPPDLGQRPKPQPTPELAEPVETVRIEPSPAPSSIPSPAAPPAAEPVSPPVTPIEPAPQVQPIAPPIAPAAPPVVAEAPRPITAQKKIATLPSGGKPAAGRPSGSGGPQLVRRAGHLVAPPRRLPPPTAKDEKKAEEPRQKPLMQVTPDMLGKPGDSTKDVARVLMERLKQQQLQQQQGVPHAPVAEVDEPEEEGGTRPGAVKGRDKRHEERSKRAKTRRDREDTAGRGAAAGQEDDDRPLKKTLIRHKIKRGTQPRRGKVPIALPITVRSLSEAIGRPANELLKRLVERGQMVTINAILAPELAEELAIEFGVDLDIKKPLDPEEQLLLKLAGEDRPEDLAPRAPIVTVMGHVDHGKTSLLDRIRESNVVATEAGGITQHLRAWRVEHNGKPVTFLDTPGHEAFTQMRARGANVTDIVVLVVAADDGVMPQTEEAISHAKAAGVPIVVAINKVDLPNANLNRTRQQLYAHELIPDTMGGDTPFVETVSTKDKARGIDELLEMLSIVAEMKDLRANAKKPGRGTCLEAKLSEGEGVVATLLLRDGTLRRGDVVICGMAYGRVRALYDDVMRPLDEAGPSRPVRITGLDEVPNADDTFQVVPDLSVAREIAEKRRARTRAAVPSKNSTFRLEDLDKAKVAELKIILKADVRGSIEAIRKELEKLTHAEVRVNLLHTGIGAITESDVTLALASPLDTMIVGFNVVPDDRAHSLSEEKGVQIREYKIIYELTDDIRAALEGKLKPREEVVQLGRAVVRQTFKISRVGTVAGCYVTQGVIERSARIRLIRDGVVYFPPADRTATIETLKRVKDDAREVREGYECGIKINGFDDVKVGDVIEAYRVDQVQRTL